MIVFLLLVVIVLIGLTTAAVMGRISGFMADPTSSQSFGSVASESLSADDIVHLRFDRAFRGYRMDQVDRVMDSLAARLSELEAQVASLPSGDAPSDADGVPSAGPGASSTLEGDSNAVGSDPQER